jgi:hypothetical protein
MRSAQSIRVGDQVQYRTNWLRSTGTYTGELPFARGRVIGMRKFGTSFLVEVDWQSELVPKLVLISNLVRVGSASDKPQSDDYYLDLKTKEVYRFEDE